MTDIARYSERTFDSIRHINEDGQEFWYARELGGVLQYSDWRNFQNAIFKAMEACKGSGFRISDHFGDATKMIELGKSAHRRVEDYVLSRYACYLIVMNGDPIIVICDCKAESTIGMCTGPRDYEQFE